MTQQMMKLVAKGSTTKWLIEKVKQVATQSASKVAVVQLELGDLHRSITAPVE